jgi:TolB-like protein
MRELSRTQRTVTLLMAWLMLQAVVGPPVAMAMGFGTVTDPPELQEPQQGPLLIGVLELDPNNVEPAEARAIADRLRIYLSRQRIGDQTIFQVIERNRMESIMEELGFQLSGACDTDECVVQVGRILGASKMVAGSVARVGSIYTIQIRLVDIASSRIEHQAFADVDGIERVLTEATQSVSAELAAAVQGQQPAPQPVVQQPVVQQPTEPEVQQPTTEEQQEAQEPRTKSKWWLWLLLLGVGGGGAYAALGAGEEVSPIGQPPERPVPPQGG